MIASFNVPVGRMLMLQQLVKKHNLRFDQQPIEMSDQMHVRISSEHLPPGSANAFFEDWRRVTTPIVERMPSPWTRMVRRVRGRLLF